VPEPLAGDALLATPGSHVDAEQRPRNLRLGSRLFVAADSFVFAAFLFGYLYLRSLNSHGMWRPPHTSPSLALGAITLATVVGSAAVLIVAIRSLHDGRASAWRGGALAALGLCLIAVVAQGWQLFDPGFSPSAAGGYGSIFVGFTAAFLAHLVGAAYWLETVIVSPSMPGSARAGGGDPVLAEAEARSYATFALLLAGVEIVAFILIYIA
jgi:heme/copper-type cytochrome/quinol oxidase subunit 3